MHVKLPSLTLHALHADEGQKPKRAVQIFQRLPFGTAHLAHFMYNNNM